MTHFSFKRRFACGALLAGALSCALFSGSACAASADQLQTQLEALAQRAQPGTLGIAVIDSKSGMQWQLNAARAYPMMSDFKAPVAAAVLARVDAGTLGLSQVITLTRADIVRGSAVPSIGDRFHGDRITVTVAELLTAAVSQSDNTAVDALLRLLGGPEKMTQFLREKGIAGMTINSDERGIGKIFDHLPGTGALASESAMQRASRLKMGYRAFLTAPPNTVTPAASVEFLRKLWQGRLLSPQSTRHLLDLMYAQTIPARMRAGLPAGYRLADKTGTSPTVDGRIAAYNDTGIIVAPDGSAIMVALYLTDSTATPQARDALYAEVARTLVDVLHPAR